MSYFAIISFNTYSEKLTNTLLTAFKCSDKAIPLIQFKMGYYQFRLAFSYILESWFIGFQTISHYSSQKRHKPKICTAFQSIHSF